MARPLQLDDLFAFRLAGDVQLSRQGDRLAYVVKSIKPEDNAYAHAIYVQSVTDGGPAVRFTHHDTDTSPRFSPDGKALAFISRRSGTAQVWRMSLAGGEAEQLTNLPGGVREVVWSPDGKRLALIAQAGAPDEVAGEVGAAEQAAAVADETDLLRKHTAGVKVVTELLHKMDGVGYFGDTRPCLFVMDATPAAEPVQLTTPPFLVSSPVWSADGTTVFVKGRLDASDFDRGGSEQQIWAVTVAGGTPQRVSPDGMSVREAAVSPDGASLAMIATWTDGMSYDNAALYIVPLPDGAAGGRAEARRVAAHYDYPLDDVGVADLIGAASGPLSWAPDGSALYTAVSERGATQLARIDLQTDEVQLLTNVDRHLYSYSFSADGRLAAFAANEPLRPGVVSVLHVDAGREEELADLNAELLRQLTLSTPERFQAQAGDDTPAVDGWIMKPHGFSPDKKHPGILYIHGGPALMYTSGFFFEFQLLAAAGYAVIFGNPRGSHGYGEAFCQAIKHEWGGPDYDDLMAIVDQALADHPWLDAQRLGVAGGSYGGYMTNWIVGHTDRFAAAVTGRSISDWRSAIGTGDLGTFRFRRVNNIPFWQDNSWYEQQSPITYVANVKTPILIEHQENDYRCPIEQALIWYSAIKYLDQAPVRLVIYPDEGHDMSRGGKPWHRVHRLQEILAWFRQYLGDGGDSGNDRT